MPEVARAGEHHGQALPVGGVDDLLIAHRAAGLDHRGGAGGGGGQQTVGEREEGVRRDHRAGGEGLRETRRPGRFRRLLGRDAR